MKESLIKSNNLRDLLRQENIQNRMREILGKNAGQFGAALIQIQERSYQLRKCTGLSILGSAFMAAALDLSVDPNLGEAHLVPYNEVCAFQIGYIGLGQLAQRSSLYRRLGWDLIRDGQLLEYDELEGEIKLDKKINPNGEIIGYAAKFSLLNGFERAEYWSKERVLAHAEQYSSAYRAGLADAKKRQSPWFTNPNIMGLKTPFKSLIRIWGPKSIQMRTALVADEAEVNLAGEVQGYPDNPVDKEPAKPDFSEKPLEIEIESKAAPAPEIETAKEQSVAAEPTGSEYNYAKAIRGLAQLKGVKESDLLDSLGELNMIEGNEQKLEDLNPSTIKMVMDHIEDITGRILETKKTKPLGEMVLL